MEAIVLSRRAYREYDQIITLYTKERGLITLVAKGVKKIQSKNNSALEPFSYVHVGVAPGKEYDYITSVMIERYFCSLREDLYKTLVASFICTTLVGILGEEEADPILYDFLLASFIRFEESSSVTLTMVDEFFLMLAGYLGFIPILDTSFQECVYSFAAGACLSSRENIAHGPTMALSAAVRQAIQDHNLSSLSEGESLVAHRFVVQFLRFSLERGIRDWADLQTILGGREKDINRGKA